MNKQTVKLIDRSNQLVATAEVVDEGPQYGGTIDLSSAPVGVRAVFNEFEEVVNGQMLSYLDEIQDKIDALDVKAVFESGAETALKDLQVFPSTGGVSFKLAGPASAHYEHSTYREKLLEHLFVGELLRHLWSRGITDAEFLRSEVDNGGYDLVIACNSIIRHIQLKSSHSEAKAASQKVNVRLTQKPSGCVVWLKFNARSLKLGPFLWFGGAPRQPLPDITGSDFPVAKHTKGNADGVKTQRPNIRVVKKKHFVTVSTIAELAEKLFGL